jgi:hypothetical protein
MTNKEKRDFVDLRDMIKPKDVNHESKKLIEEIIHNLQTDKSLSNKLIRAGISSLERCYNIVIITETNANGRIVVKEWFKERRQKDRYIKKKGFNDIIIV